jgi:hypothetical protein
MLPLGGCNLRSPPILHRQRTPRKLDWQKSRNRRKIVCRDWLAARPLSGKAPSASAAKPAIMAGAARSPIVPSSAQRAITRARASKPGEDQGRLRQRDPHPLAAQLTAIRAGQDGHARGRSGRKGRGRHGQQPTAHEPLARVAIREHEQHWLDQQAEQPGHEQQRPRDGLVRGAEIGLDSADPTDGTPL